MGQSHTTDRLVRWLAGLALGALACITGIVSYLHALAVVHATGSSGLTAYLIPFVADLMIVTASLAMLDAARNGDHKPKLAVASLAVGIGSTLAMNVTAGLAHGAGGALVASLPPVALVLSLETLIGLVRRAREAVAEVVPAGPESEIAGPVAVPVAPTDPVPVEAIAAAHSDTPTPSAPATPKAVASKRARKRATKSVTDRAEAAYGEHVLSGSPVPSLRTLMSELRVGQPKARQARAHLASLTPMNGHAPAE
jgi:hypothetical protein